MNNQTFATMISKYFLTILLVSTLLCFCTNILKAQISPIGTANTGGISYFMDSYTLANVQIPTGNNRVLVVAIVHQDKAITAVKYGTSSLTLAITTGNTDLYTSIWYLPIDGTIVQNQNIVVSCEQALSFQVVAQAFSGVHATCTIGNVIMASSSNTNSSTLSLDASSENLVLDVIGLKTNPNTFLAGSNQTELYNSPSGKIATSYQAAANPTSMLWTMGNANSSIIHHLAVELVSDNQSFEATTANCIPNGSLEISLNEEGTVMLTPAEIDNHSIDLCGGNDLTYSLDKSSFDCTETGGQMVELTVTDNENNSSSCTTMVMVTDEIAPMAKCVGNEVLDIEQSSGENTFSGLGVGQSFSPTFSGLLSKFTTTITRQGAGDLTVHLREGDGLTGQILATETVLTPGFPIQIFVEFSEPIMVSAGNVYTITFDEAVTVTYSFAANPYLEGTAYTDNNPSTFDLRFQTIIKTTKTIVLDEMGNGMLTTVSDLNNDSFDSCDGDNLMYSAGQSSFSCEDIGSTMVELMVTDQSNNSSTCMAQVMVIDEILPVAQCPRLLTLN